MPRSKSDFDKRLGATFRRHRIMAGLSQEAVGKGISVTFQQVQKYECGVNRISVETLVRLAPLVNTTAQQLIADATAEDAPITQPCNRMSLEIMKRIEGLPEKSQRVAHKVIKALEEREAA